MTLRHVGSIENIGAMFEPPNSGKTKLGLRLDSAARAEKRETALLKITTGALILAVVSLVSLRPLSGSADLLEAESILSSEQNLDERKSVRVNGDSFEVSGTPSGIRMYWVFR